MNESQRQLTENAGSEIFAAAGKASPPITVSGLAVAGVSLQDWVFIATLIYTVVQTLLLMPKLVKFVQGWRRG
ncbi:hypothetical protein V5F89_12520 [Pelagerythrobacter marensis]|uniref:Holin n=1 Tax=Pelagerythrobacter marensis TaxID=543877 RepID=A0ABZ2D4I4_9SPHN